MKHLIALGSLALVSCSALSPRGAESRPSSERVHRVSMYLGERNLDEDDYDPVDEQATFGIEYSREVPSNAIGFEIGLMGSGDDDEIGGVDVEGRTTEVYGGVRKTFGQDVVRGYVGAGLAVIQAKVEVSGLGDDDDSSAAGYLHGGLAFGIAESFFLGIDLRFLFGSDLEIAGVDTDADYGQLAAVLGFAF